MPAISVIVPVYQAESLLPQCVESVLSQTFSDWELLLVDDGSRDGSPALCDSYAAREPRIRVFHKPNGGVSSARNLGLEQAAGQCIAFLDADDAFEPAALETLWYLREKAGADSAGCAHFKVQANGQQQTELLLPAGIYEAAAIREKILWPLTGDRLRPPLFNGFIWRFLFDAAILRDNAITFEGAYLEDELFLMEYFSNARRLAVTDRPLYRYLENPASADAPLYAGLPSGVRSAFWSGRRPSWKSTACPPPGPSGGPIRCGRDCSLPWAMNTQKATQNPPEKSRKRWRRSAPSRNLPEPSGSFVPEGWDATSRWWPT